MKDKLKYIIGIVLFAALLGAAVWGYDALSEKYGAAGQIAMPENSGQSADTGDAVVNGDAGESNQTEASSEEVQLEQVPDFTVYDKGGNEVKLSDFFGKPIVLNFWATWCSPCKEELPYFQSAYETYGEEVVFMLVNLTDGTQDTVDGVTQYLYRNDYSFPVYFDKYLDAAATYGASSIPMTFFIYADGTALGVYQGTIPEESLSTYIEMILNGKDS